MPRRPPVSPERLTQLLHLTSAEIAVKLGCTANHVTTLLRRHGLTCAPAASGRPVGRRFVASREQQAIITAFQQSGWLVSDLAAAVGCLPPRLFDELSGRVPMPPERLAALVALVSAPA